MRAARRRRRGADALVARGHGEGAPGAARRAARMPVPARAASTRWSRLMARAAVLAVDAGGSKTDIALLSRGGKLLSALRVRRCAVLARRARRLARDAARRHHGRGAGRGNRSRRRAGCRCRVILPVGRRPARGRPADHARASLDRRRRARCCFETTRSRCCGLVPSAAGASGSCAGRASTAPELAPTAAPCAFPLWEPSQAMVSAAAETSRSARSARPSAHATAAARAPSSSASSPTISVCAPRPRCSRGSTSARSSRAA